MLPELVAGSPGKRPLPELVQGSPGKRPLPELVEGSPAYPSATTARSRTHRATKGTSQQ